MDTPEHWLWILRVRSALLAYLMVSMEWYIMGMMKGVPMARMLVER